MRRAHAGIQSWGAACRGTSRKPEISHFTGKTLTLDLAPGAGIRDQRAKGGERRPGGVGVSLGRCVEPFLAIAERGVGKTHAAVKPGAAAKAADHRNFYGLYHGRAGDRPGIGEIERAGAGLFEK